MDEPKKRKARDTSLPTVDKQAPAYRVIYGVFGGLTPFCKATGTAPGTAHLWLVNGLIPARRQEVVVAKAKEAQLDLDPALFVPIPREAQAA